MRAFKFHRLLILNIIVILISVFGLRNSDEPLVVDYESYFYPSLRHKMMESLSINNCSLSGSNGLVLGSTAEGSDFDLTVSLLQPSDTVRNIWGTVTKEKHIDSMKVYTQVSENLCQSKHFKSFKQGTFRRGKGCFDNYQTIKGKRVKIVNRYGATLHPSHIRCDVATSITACQSGVSSPMLVPPSLRSFHNYPFLVRVIEGVVVAKSGFLSLACGVFGLFSSCEAAKWGIPVAHSMVSAVADCKANFVQSRSIAPVGSAPRAAIVSCPLRQFERVFVMSQYDDTQIGQFILESLPRLVFHLDFLLRNPGVHIHFGFTKQPTVPNYVLPHLYFHWLGLGDRLLNGSIFTESALMPREGGCQDVSYNAWEIVNQRETLIQLAFRKSKNPLHKPIMERFAHVPQEAETGRPFIVLLERTPHSRFVQNRGDQKYRVWPNNSAPSLRAAFAQAFPQYEFRSFADNNSTLLNCPPCQIQVMARAAVVIGIHGAGMTNTIYMPRGGVVVEVLPYFDSRMAPITGIFPRVSSIIGLHHFSYFIENTILEPKKFADAVVAFHDKVRLWS